MEIHIISPISLYGVEKDNFTFAFTLILILFYKSCMTIINSLKILVTARITRFNNKNLYVLPHTAYYGSQNKRKLFTSTAVTDWFLGAFAKLRKATTSFVKSVRPSICPRRTTRLSLDGFPWNLAFEYYYKICRENSNFIKIGQQQWVL